MKVFNSIIDNKQLSIIIGKTNKLKTYLTYDHGKFWLVLWNKKYDAYTKTTINWPN
jgi:hypothetical protein